MLLNLNDPQSIVQWWRVWPERHDGLLEHMLKMTPQFAPGIREAQGLIASSPELSALLARSVRERRERLAVDSQAVVTLSTEPVGSAV